MRYISTLTADAPIIIPPISFVGPNLTMLLVPAHSVSVGDSQLSNAPSASSQTVSTPSFDLGSRIKSGTQFSELQNHDQVSAEWTRLLRIPQHFRIHSPHLNFDSNTSIYDFVWALSLVTKIQRSPQKCIHALARVRLLPRYQVISGAGQFLHIPSQSCYLMLRDRRGLTALHLLSTGDTIINYCRSGF